MPVVLFFLSTIKNYALVKLVHVAVWTISGIAALRFFSKMVRKMDESLAKNGQLMFFWMVTFGLVGAQMGWMLRPFISDPDKPFRILSNFGGNILIDLFRSLRRLG